MGRLTSIGIVDIIKRKQQMDKRAEEEKILDIDDTEMIVDDESVDAESVSITDIDVDISGVSVESVDLAEIRDEHGRISDLIESLEEFTGLSVTPLEMGHVAPEVASLERHEIFEFNGERYAMSHKIRKKVVDAYKTRIIKVLSSGLPFKESLNTVVEYDGKEYETLQLSRDEWTYLMAMFRNYKEKLYESSDGKIYYEVFPDRAQV